MKRARAVVLTIVVAFGITAVATATASAEAPEFGRCVKVAKGTGKLSSASCTAEKVGGSFEWTPGVGVGNTFTTEIKAGTIVMLLDSVEGTKITCHGETATGEYTSATTVGQVLLRFTACESSGGKAHSAGQPEGVVVSKTLEGSLGIIKRGATPKQNKIGLDL